MQTTKQPAGDTPIVQMRGLHYILAQFDSANPNQLARASLDEPLSLYYGSWGVQKGNDALVDRLDEFLCKVQNDGILEELYTSIMAPEMPAMPEGC